MRSMDVPHEGFVHDNLAMNSFLSGLVKPMARMAIDSVSKRIFRYLVRYERQATRIRVS